MTIPPKSRKKVADIVRRLLSNHDGEILAAVIMLKRITNIHDIAEHIESPVLSKDEMNKVYEEGRARSIADIEARQIEAINSADDDPEWTEAARLLHRFKYLFDRERRDFIDNMAELADDDDEPSERRLRYLFSLYRQLKAKMKELAKIKASMEKLK